MYQPTLWSIMLFNLHNNRVKWMCMIEKIGATVYAEQQTQITGSCWMANI